MEAVGSGSSLRRVHLGFRRSSGDAAAMPRPARVAMVNGFRDEGHLRYYGSMSVSCGLKKEEKRRKTMVKGLEKDLLALGELGLGVVDKGDAKDQVISEAADLLLAQLTKLRTEAKELKKKRKQEKAAMKAAAKAAKMKNCGDESSSSSSESSDSECEPVVKMNSLKTVDNPTKPESKPDNYPDPIAAALKTENVIEEAKSSIIGTSSCCANSPPAPLEKIEVCMGGKCKKSGAIELMVEFEKMVGIEGAVVGCKCMGKCRDGPNVRVVNQQSGEEGLSAVRASKGPLCIGVGLEDVGSIVSNFFGEKNMDVGLLAA